MIFTETRLKGAFLIDPERHHDERGFFARTWCQQEFAARGLDPLLVQCNISFNQRRGTLRGMHYQRPPFAEAKLVRCTRGAIHDVIIDLRAGSATFRVWQAAELTADNRRMLYIPDGFGHGFQTLEDDTEVFYQMSQPHMPEAAAGVRWNDPAFQIHWPDGPQIISDRDRQFLDFVP